MPLKQSTTCYRQKQNDLPATIYPHSLIYPVYPQRFTPIKILQYLEPGRNITSEYFSFCNNAPPAWVSLITKTFSPVHIIAPYSNTKETIVILLCHVKLMNELYFYWIIVKKWWPSVIYFWSVKFFRSISLHKK